MRTRKKLTLILVLGLVLLAFSAVSAQTPSQGDQKKQEESCCSTESCCCCSGDSCDMKMKHDANMKHDMKKNNGDCCNAKQKSKNKKAA